MRNGATVMREVDRPINRVPVSVTEAAISVIDDDVFVGGGLSNGTVNEWFVLNHGVVHTNWLSIGISFLPRSRSLVNGYTRDQDV